MNIDWQYKSQHIPERIEYWVLIQQIERDICLLYHQLAEYSSIMGDLYYGSVYALPYWNYLELEQFDDTAQRDFIRNGCLVMILCMCDEVISGAGTYIIPFASTCLHQIAKLESDDENTVKLIKAVRLGLNLVLEEKRDSEEFDDLCLWAHKTYVRGYFNNIVSEFQNNPYYFE